MAASSLLNWLFSDEQDAVRYECRNCGRSLDEELDSCPECDSDSFATYRL